MEKSKRKVPARVVSSWGLFSSLADGHYLVLWSHDLFFACSRKRGGGGRKRKLTGVSSCKEINSNIKSLTWWPHLTLITSQRPPALNTITVRSKLQHRNFGRTQTIQVVTASQGIPICCQNKTTLLETAN